jgi:hypothetical protein
MFDDQSSKGQENVTSEKDKAHKHEEHQYA